MQPGNENPPREVAYSADSPFLIHPSGLIAPERWEPDFTVNDLIKRLQKLRASGLGKLPVVDGDGIPVASVTHEGGRIVFEAGYMESESDTRRRRMKKWHDDALTESEWKAAAEADAARRKAVRHADR